MLFKPGITSYYLCIWTWP